MRLLRYCLNINWKDHIKNIDLFEKLKIEPISIQLQRRRLIFIGHCWRSIDRKDQAPNPVTDLIFWKANGTGKRGKPRSNYRKIFIQESECTEDDLISIMRDRTLWGIQIEKIIKSSISNHNKSLKNSKRTTSSNNNREDITTSSHDTTSRRNSIIHIWPCK